MRREKNNRLRPAAWLALAAAAISVRTGYAQPMVGGGETGAPASAQPADNTADAGTLDQPAGNGIATRSVNTLRVNRDGTMLPRSN